MPDKIVCPVCGEPNPIDLEFCKNCQSRLLPLTGPLKGEDAPIHPGQLPTKKVTAELEPILPEWLREARKQARQSAQEEPTITGSEKQTKPLSEVHDLLAGLANQNKDEDEVTPDWLSSITGVPASKKKNEPDSSQVKWVELGGADEPKKDAAANESPELPWMAGQGPAPEKDELTEWFKQASSSVHPSQDKPRFQELESPSPFEPDQPAGIPPAFSITGIPGEMQGLDQRETDFVKDQSEPALSPDAEVPDWIKQLDAQAPAAGQQPGSSNIPSTPAISSDINIPDWIKQLDAQAPAADQQPGTPGEPSLSSTEAANVPDWLKGLDQEPAATKQPSPESEEVFPGWLNTMGSTAQEPPASPPPEAQAFDTSQPAPLKSLDTGQLPDWITALKPIEPQESTPAEADYASLYTEQPPVEPPASAPGFHIETGQPAETTPPSPAFKTEPPAAEPAPSAFVFHTGEPPAEQISASPVAAFTEDAASSEDVDAIFASMKIPDWLSDVTESQPASEESLPPAAQAEEPIEPAELPSWVQAMRPVETAMRDSTASPQDVTIEERGALAGLLGVLPAIPGATEPTNKPKSHSIKLDATDQQQAHAALLEQILSAETAPLPMKADSVPRSQRVLRWALSAVVIVILSGVVFGKSQIFPLPSQVPNETIAAVRAVDAIPADAAVLVVFDYEPATIGEMEASGASLLDHLLLLKHPRLALISTSPTGAALAEQFMNVTLITHKDVYQPGVKYENLGYLPGGLAGVYDFSQNPAVVMPLGADSKEVWSSPVLQGVTHFSDFAAVIVLTDSADTGRIWIEQTALARGNSSMIIVSSAQAGPMILPYVDSGQVNGLVSGLNGAAGSEQANNNLPGFVRRYWDAYSLGLLLAAALMFLGGVWNFWLGIQDRRVKEAG